MSALRMTLLLGALAVPVAAQEEERRPASGHGTEPSEIVASFRSGVPLARLPGRDPSAVLSAPAGVLAEVLRGMHVQLPEAERRSLAEALGDVLLDEAQEDSWFNAGIALSVAADDSPLGEGRGKPYRRVFDVLERVYQELEAKAPANRREPRKHPPYGLDDPFNSNLSGRLNITLAMMYNADPGGRGADFLRAVFDSASLPGPPEGETPPRTVRPDPELWWTWCAVGNLMREAVVRGQRIGLGIPGPPPEGGGLLTPAEALDVDSLCRGSRPDQHSFPDFLRPVNP